MLIFMGSSGTHPLALFAGAYGRKEIVLFKNANYSVLEILSKCLVLAGTIVSGMVIGQPKRLNLD